MKSIEQQAFEAAQKYYQEAFEALIDTTFEYTAFLLTVTGILIPLLVNLWNSRQLDKAEKELQSIKNQLSQSNKSRIQSETALKAEFAGIRTESKKLLKSYEKLEKQLKIMQSKNLSMANYVLHMSRFFTHQSEYNQSQNKNSTEAQAALRKTIRALITIIRHSVRANPPETAGLISMLNSLEEEAQYIPFKNIISIAELQKLIDEVNMIEPLVALETEAKSLVLTKLEELKMKSQSVD